MDFWDTKSMHITVEYRKKIIKINLVKRHIYL